VNFLVVPLFEELKREETLGNFKKAKNMISEKLDSSSLPSLLRKRLEFELERIDRVIKNYPFTEEAAKKKLFDSIKDFSEKEYMMLMDKGILDYIIIEGEKRFEERFFENLVFALQEYKSRVKQNEKLKKAREILHKRIEALLAGDKPKTYRVTAEIKVSPKLEKIRGKKVRCWLPFPKVEAQVIEAKLLETSHNEYFIAPNEAPHRTIYMEDELRDGLEFRVRFEYVIREQFNSIDPEKVKTSFVPKFSEYLLEEPPHIVFTPYLKNLTEEIVGDELNPYLRAKKIYEWITHNVRYSYMHPYALYENIPMFVATNLKGDCGAQAVLFITMCRIAGIPARWQSGWYANPIFASPHDWTMFYVEPYGWLPADLSFGGIRTDKPEEISKFYFGNLDAFRMVANSKFMADFQPAKNFWRSDPYDNQVGELETELENIYNDAFTYEMKVLSFEEI